MAGLRTHVFIASLGHSGSTILSIALGATPGAVNLGEVDNAVGHIDALNHPCTCGAPAQLCDVWGVLFSDAEFLTHKSYAAAYRALHDALWPESAAEIPQTTLVVDSSKDIAALSALKETAALSGVDVKVIFLVKDPRGYFVSHYRKWLKARGHARKPGRHRAAIFPLELCVAALNWWWANRRILRELRRGGYNYQVLSYENMVLDTASSEARLSEFLGVPVNLHDYSLAGARQHILRGNGLRHDPNRSAKLRYDYRWFHDPWVRRLGFLFNPMLRWGAKNGLL